eukprot:TRINITY_DN562_c2_g1_i2.p2 TRINITY_DN562_c2_g1~~TRINITY_DN562_c2_g1_i2.p2  ORF type:complete len:234 (-),score=22.81 TRINITY_DN562_c2_g1_i2:95-796(-)
MMLQPTHHKLQGIPRCCQTKRAKIQVQLCKQRGREFYSLEFELERRWAITSGLCFLSMLPVNIASAQSKGNFGKYIKTKSLDPLSTYVPPVLVVQEQLQGLKMELNDPGLTVDPKDVRDMLRSGSFSGLRSDIRAILQYAYEDGRIEDESVLLNQFLRPFEKMDTKLLQYVRNGQDVDKDIEDELNRVSTGLEEILATLPTNILEKAQLVVDQRKEVVISLDSQDEFLQKIIK